MENKNLKEFIDELSEPTPIPGGGAVAALNGVLAASLIIMVSGITIKSLQKKLNKGENIQEITEKIKKLENIINTATELKDKLLKGIQQDIDAYNQVVQAYKLPKNTEEEIKIRNTAILDGLKTSTLVPLKNAQNSLVLKQLSEELETLALKSTSSDVTVAKLNAESSISGALANVHINLDQINDEDFKEKINTELKAFNN